jgi:hypothetical protein
MKILFVFVLACATPSALAQSLGSGTVVYGGDASDGWAFTVAAPPGWTLDCCEHTRELDADLLVFPKNWDGHDSDRVMALTVWPKERADVDADWQADALDYFAHFPGLTSITYYTQVKDAGCVSSNYVSADHISDYVVFCDPGSDWNYRFAWSMSVRAGSAAAASEDAFRETVAATTPMHMHISAAPQ